MSSPAWGKLLCVLAVAWLLVGCAADSAVRQGEQLIAEGRIQEGLTKLREAADLEPTSAQFRMAYLRHRERAFQALLDRAEGARLQNRPDAAEGLLRDALNLQPADDRAEAGLRMLANERRWVKLLMEAEALLARTETDAAKDKIKQILVESPRHARARALDQQIDQAAKQPAAELALAASFRQPVSIEFKDTPLRTVFDILSRTAGLNFIFDKEVRGDQKTSVVLRNSTIEAAVNLLLLTNQLEQRIVDANTVLIYPSTANKLREYQPLTVRSFYLSHADAKSVANTIKAIAKTRDLVVDDKLNLLIVRDSPAAIRVVEKLVALHDVPEPEVMLEVEILEVKRTRLLDLGVRLPDQLSLSPLGSGSGGALTLRELRGLNSGGIGAALGSAAINFKQQETDANLLANPRIRSRNREKAKILIGERVPNITTTLTSTGFASDSVTYVDVGLKLDVEPVIYPDGDVAIRVALEVSNIIGRVETKSGSVAYQIGTRGAQTVLRLADGENQVLAGLISDEDRRTAYKLPGMGSLPLVGRLFGSQADDSAKTEIVLSITPRILRNIPRPTAQLAEFESGTEAGVGQRSPLGMQQQVLARVTPTTAAAGVATTPSEGAASGSVLNWGAPKQVRVGDMVAVQVQINTDVPIADLPLSLAYDPLVLQLQTANEGEFMRQGGAASLFASRTEPAGQVTLGMSKADGARGRAALVTLNFRALAASAGSAITVTSASATAPGGKVVPLQELAPHLLVVAP